MERRKITIHAALGELKKLDDRINKAIQNSNFIGFMKNSAEKVSGTTYNEEEFKTSVLANYQSVTDLIALRDRIKSAVTMSNATTKVTIDNIDMSVAEAIEKKSSIEYQKQLLRKMTSQYDNAVRNIAVQNERMEEELNVQITALTSKGDAKAVEKMTGFMEQYRGQHGWKDIDPLKLKDRIDTLSVSIANFETDVDVVLSISNATTHIEIDV